MLPLYNAHLGRCTIDITEKCTLIIIRKGLHATDRAPMVPECSRILIPVLEWTRPIARHGVSGIHVSTGWHGQMAARAFIAGSGRAGVTCRLPDHWQPDGDGAGTGAGRAHAVTACVRAYVRTDVSA